MLVFYQNWCGEWDCNVRNDENVAKSFCNSDVEIIEYNDEFRLKLSLTEQHHY
ncbi:MAG: hypothetical protein ACLTE2_02325 [Eubacteriales bacterium]